MPRIPGSKADSGQDNNDSRKELPKYDSLINGVPYESSDRATCHPRNTLEEIKTIRQSTSILCSDDSMSGFPIKELERYDNKELTYIVECSLRIIIELQRWIDEKMSYEMFCYYVYNENPCQKRLLSVNQNIDHLTTKLHFHKPQLGDKVKTVYDVLKNKACETDNYYKSLSKLPYWNEKYFNPVEVKQYAESLRSTLLHIESMAYGELKKEYKPAEAEQKKRGRPKEHSEDKIRTAKILFDELQGEGKSVNECWFEVHKKLGFSTPEAAKQAVYRFKKQNKKHN